MENLIVVCKTVEVDEGNVIDFFVQDAIEVLTEMQSHAEYTLTFGNSEEFPKDQESYENEMTGSPRRGFGYYQYKPVAEDGGYFVEIGFNQLSYTFYGQYRTTVYSIDDNYYSYLYKYEGYKHGGVHNGYGYFGSANGQQMWSKVIK